jgi:hypothetical protein
VCPVRLEWPADQPRGVLYVATSQAENLKFVDELAFAVGHVVKPVLALATDIERALRQHGVLGNQDLAAIEFPPEDLEDLFVIER